MPRRSGFPRGEEVESRGWRRGAPQSPSPSSFGAPQGTNEIYNNDTVFRIGEANKNDYSQTPFPYNKSKEYQQTQLDKPTQFDKPTASQSTCPQVRMQERGTESRISVQ